MRAPDLSLVLLATVGLSVPAGAQQPDSVVELPRIGQVRISAVYDLVAAPPFAYALERENLRVLDVRDPREVREVANLEFPGPRLWGVLYGSGLYLGGFGRPLAVIDVSDPLRPRWLGPVPHAPEPRAGLVHEDRLFMVEPGPSLTLSVSRLNRTAGFPERIATLALDTKRGQRFSGIDYHAGRLYVLLERPRSVGSQLAVINVEDPSRPMPERRITLPALHDYRKVSVRGSFAYATIADADGAFGLATLGLGDTTATVLGSVTDSRLWNGGRMIVNGDAIYVTYKYEAILATFDVSDPSRPRLAHTFMTRGGASGLGFSRAGDRLYVSGDAGPASILDVSDPLAPSFLGSWNYAGGWARSIALHGHEAVVLNWGLGFQVYNIADPTTPVLLGAYVSRNGAVDNLWRERDLVLISGDSLPTEVVDISDTASPVLVARYSVPRAVSAGALNFPRAVQALRDGGLMITDVRAPEEPLGFIELESAGTDLVIQDSLVLIAHPNGGISIVDITHPESPRLVGRAAGPAGGHRDPDGFTARLAVTPDDPRAFTIAGETEEEDGSITFGVFDLRASSGILRLASLEVPFVGYAQDYTILVDEDEVFIGAGSDVIRIDVRNPAEPRIAERYRISTDMEGLAKQGRLLVVAASEDGVQFFELPSR